MRTPKIELLFTFAQEHNIPVLEVPFEVSFRDVMSLIMERFLTRRLPGLSILRQPTTISQPLP